MMNPSVVQKWINTTPNVLQVWLGQWQGEKRKRMDIALNFFKKHFGNYEDKYILSELMCIDFAYPVRVISLPPKTTLVGYKDPRVSPFRGKYFTISGTPTDRLGLSSKGSLRYSPKAMNKTLVRYTVNVMIPEVLESRCAATSDRWSDQQKQIMVGGGGLQYVIPQAYMYMVYTTPFPNRSAAK